MIRPDFLIIGGQTDDGRFYLTASRTLRDINIRFDSELDRRGLIANTITTIGAEIGDCIQVVANSYAEAFRSLLSVWTPKAEQRTGIDSRKAIES